MLDQLGERDVKRGLVLDDGRLVGLVSITDLAWALQDEGRRPLGLRKTRRWSAGAL